MNRYVINILASRDINEIADYFAETSVEAGERFFREFHRKCQNPTKSFFGKPLRHCEFRVVLG